MFCLGSMLYNFSGVDLLFAVACLWDTWHIPPLKTFLNHFIDTLNSGWYPQFWKYIYIYTEIVSMIIHVPCILMLHTETWHWKSQARYCLRSVKKDDSTTNPIMLGAISLLWVVLDVLHIWGFPKMVVPPFHTPKWSFLVGKPMVVGYHHFRKQPYVDSGPFLTKTAMLANENFPPIIIMLFEWQRFREMVYT